MDRPMEFEEVRDILKQVIPVIKDSINTGALIDYMNFTESTIQEIRAQNVQNGMPGSSHHFFDAVRQKPNNLRIMMAALLKIEQKEIYKRIYTYMRDTYYRDNRSRFDEVLKMIQNDVDSMFNFESKRPQVYPEVDDNPDNEGQAELPQCNITGIPTSSDQTSATPLPPRSSRSPPTPPRIQPEGCPTVLPPKQVETEVVYTRTNLTPPDRVNQNQSTASSLTDNTLADVCILDLQANVFDKLAEELIRPCVQNKQWWNYLVNKCDQINVTRNEQRHIEKSEHPGKAFLDLLGDRRYTCSNLADLFKDMNMADALNVLEQNAYKVVRNTAPNNNSTPYKEDMESFDENNLNNAVQRSVKDTAQKDINVTAGRYYSTAQCLSLPPNIHTGDILREQLIQPLQPSPSSSSLKSDLGQSNTSIQSGNIPNTVPNTLGSCTSEDEDAPMKPSQSIAAVADPTGKTSTHNSEREADKLRDDRVHQHDDDKSNLHSFQDLKINSDPSTEMRAGDNENVSHEFGSNIGQPALNIQAQGTVATARGETVGPADNERPFKSVTPSKQAEGQSMDQGTLNAYTDIHSKNLAENQIKPTNNEFLDLNAGENLSPDSLESGNQSEQDEQLSRDETGAGTRPGNNNKDMDND